MGGLCPLATFKRYTASQFKKQIHLSPSFHSMLPSRWPTGWGGCISVAMSGNLLFRNTCYIRLLFTYTYYKLRTVPNTVILLLLGERFKIDETFWISWYGPNSTMVTLLPSGSSLQYHAARSIDLAQFGSSSVTSLIDLSIGCRRVYAVSFLL